MLLTGLSGQVSLMQMSFVGIGAVVVAKLGADTPWLLGLLLAAVVAGVVGCLVALPVLRLRGIYLALCTLAFAILMDGWSSGTAASSAAAARWPSRAPRSSASTPPASRPCSC